ncbi:MAG: hypothetical protein JWO46_1730 [Nocardioidaceae bacterium]|nr:hypothetical protein [Nocardioidaceae bacterium]
MAHGGGERVTPARAAVLLGLVLLVTGTLHFAAPAPYESIVPAFLGSPAFWVYVSGVAELGCAVGLLVRRTRRPAGLATAVLFVAVFPANLQMAVDALQGDGNVVVALVRLPLQVPLIWWAWYAARPDRPPRSG